MARSRLSILTAAAWRHLLWRYASGRTPFYLVTEFPKSGGTWLSQLLAALLDLPYPRNERPRLEPSVLHGHRLWDPAFRNVTVMHRDGRDIMVSAYFHYLGGHDANQSADVERHRRRAGITDVADTTASMPRFIEYMFTKRIHRLYDFTWAEFVDSWQDREAAYVRYEELLVDAVGALGRVLRRHDVDVPARPEIEAVVERFSFTRQSGRTAGTTDAKSFLRKGVAGDWKNHFSDEAREVFNHYAGSQLVSLGYESTRAWRAWG